VTERTQCRAGFSAIEGREAKARKILTVLDEAGHPLIATHRVLDVGTGSGQIAAVLGEYAQVVSTDRVDQRIQGQTLPFVVADSALPFPDASFDLVISNHVIEHTGDPKQHLCEIRRLLSPGGLAYLATPNRRWPWEFHTRLPVLHYLPAALFNRLAMHLQRSDEPLYLLSLPGLEQLCGTAFHVASWHQRIVRQPARYWLRVPHWARCVLATLPVWITEITRGWQPTLIVLLYPR